MSSTGGSRDWERTAAQHVFDPVKRTIHGSSARELRGPDPWRSAGQTHPARFRALSDALDQHFRDLPMGGR